jgi:outer membrane protein
MKKLIFSLMALTSLSAHCQQRQWTLKDCIDYATQNNITLKQAVLKKQSATEDRMQSKAALFPSLTATTNQSVGYAPWQETVGVKKGYYSGTYGINAQWTIWNGGRNVNALKQSELAEEQAELSAQQTANNIQERIAQLYVQILYMNEAIDVNLQSLEASKKNEERGKIMLEVGKISKADLAQLTAQRATDEYNLVAAQSNLADYKLQLKQLLEITDDPTFDIAMPQAADEQALTDIPSLQSVYEQALLTRPEVKNQELAITKSELQIDAAKSGYLPTVSLTGGVGTSTSSRSSNGWGEQMKTNFDATVGVGVSIPLIDNRKNKTAVRKAKIEREQALLSQQEVRKELYTTIEGFWLDANSNQQKFRAARVSVDSEQQSYDLLSEQFQLGLKNIVELMNGKTNLLQAQQNKLQSKYTTILNIQLLHFYEGKQITL